MRMRAGLLAAALLLCGCGTNGAPKIPPALSVSPRCPIVRVLLGEAETVRISGEVEFALRSGEKTAKLKAGEEVVARVEGELVRVGDVAGKEGLVEAAFDGTLKVFGLHWRGALLLLPRGGKVRVINIVPMEAYLVGVVGQEMGGGFLPEALAAQAIAARTYALWMVRHPRHPDYHLTRTPDSQAYGGVEAESLPVRQAVRATAGRVLTFKGKIFPAFYHAVCGGRTSSAAFVFGNPVQGTTNRGLGPLDGGVDCTYCEDTAPKHRFLWSVRLTQKEALSLLKKAGYQAEKVEAILPAESDDAGRHKAIIFKTDRGDFRISVARMRRLLKNDLLSSLFSIKQEGGDFVIEGRGWGHGVGMCQWGAEGMARLSFSCAEILEFYYRNTTIKRMW